MIAVGIVALVPAATIAGHNQGAAVAGAPPPAYNGVPITAGTPNYVKLCALINCVAIDWNATVANQITRKKNSGRICLETGSTNAANPGHYGSNVGSGASARINLPLRSLCNKELGTGILLHENAHGHYTNMPSPTEHCRVWFIQYKYHRQQQTVHAAGTAARNLHDRWVGMIQGWYNNFQATYDNGGMGQADAPPPVPLPAVGNACRTSMASITPPSGPTRTAFYSTAGTATLRCDSWPDTGPSTVATALFAPPGATVISDWRLTTTTTGSAAIVGVAQSPGGGMVFNITDTTGDGSPDTLTVPIGTGSGIVTPVAIERTVKNGVRTWYALDHGSSRVVTLLDTNADGLPDSVGATFADSALTPLVNDAPSLALRTEEQLELHSEIALHSTEISESQWRIALIDGDSDGVAEGIDRLDGYQGMRLAPLTVAGGRIDDQFILADGAAGNTVEARGLDQSTGQYTVVLGVGTLGADGRQCIPLSQPLTASSTYQLVDTTDNLAGSVLTPEPKNSPQPYFMSPTVGDPVATQVVTLRGYGFLQGTSNIKVRFGSLYGTVLNATDSEILVETPVFGIDRRVDVDVVVEKNSGQEICTMPVQYHTIP